MEQDKCVALISLDCQLDIAQKYRSTSVFKQEILLKQLLRKAKRLVSILAESYVVLPETLISQLQTVGSQELAINIAKQFIERMVTLMHKELKANKFAASSCHPRFKKTGRVLTPGCL